ncbi:hypothetical protein [Nitrosomonas cryotolerans]|uniref:hypothetical protein n=1 Tax=Nitrosomonas cryotolerans TaxID=44575 RepID=UPI0015BC0639|nr:hypothetical protein [Nitrosomonas cryotolerans]
MTSPPFLTHAMVALSRLKKYSSVPGGDEIGGTISLTRAQVSGSSDSETAPSMAGNGHNLHGSPGHRQPLHAACVGIAITASSKVEINMMTILNLSIHSIFITSPDSFQ